MRSDQPDSSGASAEPTGIEAVLARLPQPSAAEYLAVRRAAEQAPPPPPTTLPMPDFLPGGVVRYRCPLGCPGWHHDERPGMEETGPLLLPANPTSRDISAALTSAAEVRGNTFQLRVEQAIADHFTQAHPGRG